MYHFRNRRAYVAILTEITKIYSCMVEIEVAKYYSNRGYYPYIPVEVFDALEAAYLSGASTARVPESAYNLMLSRLTAL